MSTRIKKKGQKHMENKELFNRLLIILDEFDRVCKAHNLNYYILGGTLLGAVRHSGFIPWDDDIDLVMLREDYDKLLKISNTAFSYPFFLQTPATDPGYHKGLIKIRDNRTTEIPYGDAGFNYNHGIFIDVFPIDAIPSDKDLFRKQVKQLKTLFKLLHFTGRVFGGVGTKGYSNKNRILYYILLPLCKLRIITPSKLFKKLNNVASMYEGDKTEKIGLLTFDPDNTRFINFRDDYADTVYLPFEGRLLPAPVNYDRILATSYGDYMKPMKQKSEHGDTFVDTKTSYKDFISANKELLDETFDRFLLDLGK